MAEKTLVQVRDPEGTIGTIPAENLSEAVSRGYSPLSKEEVAHQEALQAAGGNLGAARAFGESGLSAASFGLSRELENATGLTTPEQQALYKEAHPTASKLGTATGIVAPLALTAGAAAPELAAGELGGGAAGLTAADALNPVGATVKVGHKVADAVSPAISKAVSTIIPDTMPVLSSALTKAGAGLASGATEGALYGLGNQIDEHALGDPDALGEHLLAGMGNGALWGGGISAGLGLTGPFAQKAAESLRDSSIYKKGLSVLGGVPEEHIDRYLAAPDVINNTPDMRDIYDQTLPHVQKVFDDLESGKLNLADAKNEFSKIESGAKDQFRQGKFDASQAASNAKMMMSMAAKDLNASLEKGAIDSAQTVTNAVEKLRKNVIDQSAASYDLLTKSGATVELSPILKKSDELIDELRGNGTLEGQQMADKISAYKENLEESFGTKNVPADKAKELIQGLDPLTKYNFGASNFDNGISKYYKQLRFTLDDTLKEAVPEYRAAMAPLAKDTKLLSSINKYGDEASASRALKSIKSPVNLKNEMPLLKQLEERTGGKFTGEVERYADSEKRQNLINSLPEMKEAQKTANVLKHLQNPETQATFLKALEDTPEFQRLTDAHQALADAQLQKASLGGISPNNLESKLKASMNGGFNVEKAISQLPGINGKSLDEVLDNLKTKQAFEGGHAIGSKNVNTGTALGGAIGMLSGHLAGGIAGGAALGSFADKYGHQMTKSVLDAVLGAGEKAKAFSGILKEQSKGTSAITQAARGIFKGLQEGTTGAVTGLELSSKPNEKVFDHIDQMANDPDTMIAILNHNTQGLSGVAPSVSMGAHAAMIRATKFLAGKIPKPVTQKILSPKYSPSKSEMSRFNGYFNTIKHPTGVIKGIKFGLVSPDQMETLKSVYPSLLSQMQMSVVEELSDHLAKEKDISYQTKLGLSAFLEKDLTNSLDQRNIAINQSNSQGVTAQKAQLAGAVKSTQKGLGTLSKDRRLKTSLQSISDGDEA